jgi:thiol-disulfide isomerase/thioredoxin
MKAFLCVPGSVLSRRFLVVFISAMFLGSLSAAALPEPGTPAPPLQFTQLLQAPPGTKTDWESLRGKVVVLEFWETHCGPCIAEIPHLSKLIAELDPAKFQFIHWQRCCLVWSKGISYDHYCGWTGSNCRGDSPAESYDCRFTGRGGWQGGQV